MSLRLRAAAAAAGFACVLYGLYLLVGEAWTWVAAGVVIVAAAVTYDDRPRQPAPPQGDRTVR